MPVGIEIAVVAGLGAAGLIQQNRQQAAQQKAQRKANSLAAAAAALDNRDSYEQRLIQFQEFEADLAEQRTGLDATRLEIRSFERQAEADRLSRQATYDDRSAEFDRGITEARRGISDARDTIDDAQRDRVALRIQQDRDQRDLGREASADSAYQRVVMAASGASGTASAGAMVDAKTKEYSVASGRILQDFSLEDNVLRERKKRANSVIGDYRDDINTLNKRKSADAAALEKSNSIAAADVADNLKVRKRALAHEKNAILDAEKRLKQARDQARESFKRADPQGRYYEDILEREAYDKTPAGKRDKKRAEATKAQQQVVYNQVQQFND